MIQDDNAPAATSIWAPQWWAVLGIGFLLWAASIGAALLTHDILLIPTIVMLGSFLVPVTAVVWYLDHDPSPDLSPRRVLGAFILAGVIGVLGAAVLEYYAIGAGLPVFFAAGLVEEFVKGLLIVFVAIGIRSFATRDGIVLGAAVGFGFAAFESSGYALISLFVIQGHQLYLSLTSVVATELIRGVLAPFGHGMWSAILGGAIFSAARHVRLSSVAGVLIAYLVVATLHTAFDSINGIVGYVVVSVFGLIPLVWMWRRSASGGVFSRHRTMTRPSAG